MCLIALAIAPSAGCPLLLAANRDEFFQRPTQPLSRWHTPSGALVLGGRDLQAGGTWLGVSAQGRVAMLTNVREPGSLAGPRSRGDLPLAWLGGQQAPEAFLAGLEPQAYSGFNLVVGDLQSGRWYWASNRQTSAEGISPGWQQRPLGPGLYGLSNAFLDTPWPKTEQLKSRLKAALTHPGEQAELLWSALADASPAPPEALPNTGVSAEAERHLSSAWVRFPDGRYGTRASTLMEASLTPQGLSVRMQEKTWLPEGGQALREDTLAWPDSTAA